MQIAGQGSAFDARRDDATPLIGARQYRILKLARTIADLAECEEIASVHLAEAIQYRPKLMG